MPEKLTHILASRTVAFRKMLYIERLLIGIFYQILL